MYTVFCHAVLQSAMFYAQGGLTIILFAKNSPVRVGLFESFL